jgi:hypothetical protein
MEGVSLLWLDVQCAHMVSTNTKKEGVCYYTAGLQILAFYTTFSGTITEHFGSFWAV